MNENDKASYSKVLLDNPIVKQAILDLRENLTLAEDQVVKNAILSESERAQKVLHYAMQRCALGELEAQLHYYASALEE